MESAAPYKLPSALVLHEALRTDGEELLDRHCSSLFWSGIGGGMAIGLSVITAAVLHASLPAVPWAIVVVALGTTVGYLVVILGRQGLITESTMVAGLHVLAHPRAGTAARFVATIAVVAAANVLAALIIAIVLAWTGLLDPEHRSALAEIGRRTLSAGATGWFLRSVTGGWAVALAVWTAPAAGGGRVLMTLVLAYVTGLAGLTHLVAGSIEVMHLALRGDVGWSLYLLEFLPIILTGNLIGGFVLAACLTHLQVGPARRQLSADLP